MCLTEKKRKDYAFQRQFNEKPSIIPGCPGIMCLTYVSGSFPFLLVSHITTPHISKLYVHPHPPPPPQSQPHPHPHPKPSRPHPLVYCQSVQVMAVAAVKGPCLVHHNSYAFQTLQLWCQIQRHHGHVVCLQRHVM
jgi:hypothetical protein